MERRSGSLLPAPDSLQAGNSQELGSNLCLVRSCPLAVLDIRTSRSREAPVPWVSLECGFLQEQCTLLVATFLLLGAKFLAPSRALLPEPVTEAATHRFCLLLLALSLTHWKPARLTVSAA